MLSGNEIRKLYLDYFKDKHQHTVVESSSLVPDNPTVLLTTAGMLQFLPIFLGIVKSPYDPARATSCQKCARAGGKDSDIENVGRTPRHPTFFEMLGNWSLGDYFKKESIEFSFEFLTRELNMKLMIFGEVSVSLQNVLNVKARKIISGDLRGLPVLAVLVLKFTTI